MASTKTRRKTSSSLKLTELQKDALREIGTMGAGHAATALSQLVDKKILITVPRVQVVPVEMMPELMGGPENLVAAIKIEALGNLAGTMIFILSREDALFMMDMLRGRKSGLTRTLGEVDEELFKQTGNLLATAYLNALTRFTGLTLLPSSPSYAFDMLGAIVGSIVAEIGMRVQQAVVIDTDFLEVSAKVKGRLIFLPEPESLRVILKAAEVR